MNPLWERLEYLGACGESLVWAQQYESQVLAWNDCKRPDWLIWILVRMSGRPGWPSLKEAVALMCGIVTPTLGTNTGGTGDDKVRQAIALAQSWCDSPCKEVSGCSDLLLELRDCFDEFCFWKSANWKSAKRNGPPLGTIERLLSTKYLILAIQSAAEDGTGYSVAGDASLSVEYFLEHMLSKQKCPITDGGKNDVGAPICCVLRSRVTVGNIYEGGR